MNEIERAFRQGYLDEMEKIAFINENKTNEQIVNQSNRIDKLQLRASRKPGQNMFTPRGEEANRRAGVVSKNVNNHFTMGRGQDSVQKTRPHSKLTNEHVKNNINKDMSIGTKGPYAGMAMHRQEMINNNDKG